MLAHQRHAQIVALVQRQGAVRVSDLTETLAVSDMTVRRDLEVLAERGLVEKVHGGAVSLERRSADEPGFAAKSSLAKSDKEAIARIFEPVAKRSSRPVWLSSARRPVSDRPPVVSPREIAASNGSANGSNGSAPNGHSNLGGEPTDVGNDLGHSSD